MNREFTDVDSLTVQGDITDFDFAALATANGRPTGAVAAGRPHDFRALWTVLDQADGSRSRISLNHLS